MKKIRYNHERESEVDRLCREYDTVHAIISVILAISFVCFILVFTSCSKKVNTPVIRCETPIINTPRSDSLRLIWDNF